MTSGDWDSLALYPIEAHFNTFANRVDPDQAAHTRALILADPDQTAHVRLHELSDLGLLILHIEIL